MRHPFVQCTYYINCILKLWNPYCQYAVILWKHYFPCIKMSSILWSLLCLVWSNNIFNAPFITKLQLHFSLYRILYVWALRKEREIHSSFGTFGFPKSHFSLLTSWSDHSGKGSLLGSSASVAVEALAPVTEEALDFLFIDPNAVIRTQMTHWRSYLTFVKWLLSRKSTLTQIKSRRYSITITNVQDQGRGSRNYHNN